MKVSKWKKTHVRISVDHMSRSDARKQAILSNAGIVRDKGYSVVHKSGGGRNFFWHFIALESR
jgi:hypothetical protein